MESEPDYEQIARHAAERLRDQFPNHADEQIRAAVHEELVKLRSAKVKDYLSVLTVRAVEKRMRTTPAGDSPGIVPASP